MFEKVAGWILFAIWLTAFLYFVRMAIVGTIDAWRKGKG